jgi:hypothetical protein
VIIELNPSKWFAKTLQPTNLAANLQAAKAAVQQSTPAKAVESNMANIFTDIEHVVEVGAEDALKILSMGTVDLTKVASASPKVIAALGVVIAASSKALASVDAAAQAGGLSIALDQATVANLKAVWPDVTAFLLTLGIKL